MVGWIYMRRQGETGKLLSFDQIKYRWRRYRMRQKLRVARSDDQRRRKEERRNRTFH